MAPNWHAKAFAAWKVYILVNIINNGEVHQLTDVNDYYRVILREMGRNDSREIQSAANKLEKRLLKKYSDKLKIEKGKTRKGNIVFS